MARLRQYFYIINNLLCYVDICSQFNQILSKPVKCQMECLLKYTNISFHISDIITQLIKYFI